MINPHHHQVPNWPCILFHFPIIGWIFITFFGGGHGKLHTFWRGKVTESRVFYHPFQGQLWRNWWVLYVRRQSVEGKPRETKNRRRLYNPIRIHVWYSWYIYLHLVDFYGKLVAKYTSPMDTLGKSFIYPPGNYHSPPIYAYLKMMMFLFPSWDMYPFPGGYTRWWYWTMFFFSPGTSGNMIRNWHNIFAKREKKPPTSIIYIYTCI